MLQCGIPAYVRGSDYITYSYISDSDLCYIHIHALQIVSSNDVMYSRLSYHPRSCQPTKDSAAAQLPKHAIMYTALDNSAGPEL